MASGIRISLNLNNCSGPLTVADGVLTELDKAIGSTEVSVCKLAYHTFSDDTVTWVAILQESHVAVSIYLETRHVTIDVHMCNETQDNTVLARSVAEALSNIFKPGDIKQSEDTWISS